MDFATTEVAKSLALGMASIGALAGRSPLSGAAACIYMASLLMDQVRSPKAIGEVAKVSDSTIRSAYKSLYAEKETLLSEDVLKRGADVEKLVKPTN
ncbi:hypothetical protein KCU77_g16232, partial [Aureobasidium melanogenum]